MIAQGHIEPATGEEAEAAHEARIRAHAERLRGVWQSAEPPVTIADQGCTAMLTAAAGITGRTLAEGFGVGGGKFRPGPASSLSWKWLALCLLRRRGHVPGGTLGTSIGKMPRYIRQINASGWYDRMADELLRREAAVEQGLTPEPLPVTFNDILETAERVTGHSREAMLTVARGAKPGPAFVARWAAVAVLDDLGGSINQQMAECNVPGACDSHKATYVAKIRKKPEGQRAIVAIRDGMVWGWPER